MKLIRLLRLGRMITYLNFTQQVKIGFRVFLLIFMYLLTAHWIACISFYIVSLDEDWVPPKDQGSPTFSLYTDPPASQYILMYYYAVLNIIGEEINAEGNFHVCFASLICIFG